ncbi:MAG: hypothetical protein Q4G50_02800 [Corynebacterium sp.]|uniref:hypothetical protein n=1 Tax=Corynebacterium sp. TaxID=1720 RepID=UPI0026DF14DD|nr:hypothetical protein [Corynebacterium sp.]MDO5668913.1 hypothetical protein [Corynebacterium sp.]
MATNNFFLSPKNLVGMIIAVVVIVVHLIVGLGFLWPLVAALGWGAGVALTPAARGKELPPAPAEKDGHSLLGDLDRTSRKFYAALPANEVLDSLAVLRGSLREVLVEWDRLDDVPEQRVVLEAIVDEYLPATLRGYLAVTDRHHPQAIRQTTGSLGLLNDEVKRIRQALLDDTLRELEDQNRALRLQFGRLPAPRYDTEL